MSLTKIAAFGPAIRRRSAVLLAFPLAAIVAPSYTAARLAAETYLDGSDK